ncbi:helix-turn-helix domain-containing protein [Hufsiella ginkgonis]|uniref:Helix-turn-helix domain-containing protein n=1 Tax=Hufsiella ginkgonis TaxID=2695274 RepID=A0A7K1Y1C2_9SPHI|nr:helix-turn-helix transcriptional regulator [Hufsiella ginkgonis]MXV16878.1 helix-turn-helix domain-containing protein [Hufsiella ginkgonis]
MAINTDLIKRFRSFRKKYVGTQKDASELLNVSMKHVSNIETGDVSISLDILSVLVKKKQLNPTWFFDGTGSPVRNVKEDRKLIHDVSELRSDIDLIIATIKDMQGQVRLIALAVDQQLKPNKRL